MNALKRKRQILEIFAEHIPGTEIHLLPLRSFSPLEPESTGCGYTVPTVLRSDLYDIHLQLQKR
jgi:hypothetical protein